MAFRLAELFIEIGAVTAPLDHAIKAVETRAKAAGSQVAAAFKGAGIAALGIGTGAIIGIGAALYKGVKGASDLNESLSKAGVVFGESTSKVTGMADQMAKSFGLPKQALIDAASSFGLITKAAGQSQSAAADMSVKMAKLAADASSFYNVPLEDALQKIRSGLVGEAEPIRSFGVLLSEAAVKAEAMSLGLSKTGKDLNEQTKVMARASLITKGLADATGDLERTQSSTSNQFRKLGGNITNTLTEIGAVFLPIVTKMTGMMSGAVDRIRETFETLKPFFEEFVATLGVYWDGLGTLAAQAGGAIKSAFGNAMDGVGAKVTAVFKQIFVVMRNLPEYVEIARLGFVQKFMNMVEVLRYYKDMTTAIAKYTFDYWKEVFTGIGEVANGVFGGVIDVVLGVNKAILGVLADVFGSLSKVGGAVGESAAKVAGAALDTLRKGFAEMTKDVKPPQFIDNAEAIAAVEKRIAVNEAAFEVNQQMAKSQDVITTATKGTTAAIKAENKEKEKKHKDSRSFGIADYARELQAAQLSEIMAKKAAAAEEIPAPRKTAMFGQAMKAPENWSEMSKKLMQEYKKSEDPDMKEQNKFLDEIRNNTKMQIDLLRGGMVGRMA